MRTRRLAGGWWLAAAAAALCITACASPPEEELSPVVTVDVAPVLSTDIQRIIRAHALIYPWQQAAIVPKIAAPIKTVYVERGAHVRAGQLLLELEHADLAGVAQENDAAYQLAQATYETTARATVPQATQKAELDVRAAKGVLDAQQAVFDSRQQLFREGAIAQKDVNDAHVALTQARNQYEIAQKQLDDRQGFAGEQALKAAAAERDQAQGRRAAAQAQLSYARISSPINGTVTNRPMYPGETPQSGSPVMTVMDLSQVIARAHITPAEAAELAVGNDAAIVDMDGTSIPGKVTQISPALDPESTTVEVWVQALNAGERLKPGTSLQIELIAKTVQGTLVIPQSALVTSPSGATSVIVIDSGNSPHKTSVTVGIRDAERVQITSGLSNGQRVATTGAFELSTLDPAVLAKATAQIQPPKEDDEEDDTP
jgi:multidrug efflux pump subunit AcrA (membrane-fusion protein)